MNRDADEFRELIVQAKAGNSASFGQLYELWYTPVFRFVLSRVSVKETAEDITQDVFMKTFTHLDRFEMTSANPLGFLFTVARNTIIDHHKKKKAGSLEALELGDILDEDAQSPEHEASVRIDKGLLGEALLKLTDIQQDVLHLRLIEEKPVKEVADMLGKTEEAIRQTQVRALKALREIMKEYA